MSTNRYWWPATGTPVSRRRALGITAGSFGAAVLAAACRGGKAGSGPNAVAGQAGKPRYGGQLNLSQKTDPDTLDPSSKRTPSAQTMSLTSDSLLAFKTGPDVKYDDKILQPAIAERWEVPDAQTYTFHLRKDVRFANLAPVNGRQATSADVKFSYEYYARLGSFKNLHQAPVAATFAGLESVDTPDDYTVTMRFNQPYAAFLPYNASEWSAILAHEIFDQDGDFSKRTVGTGPWQLDSAATQRGARWAFRKNPTYFVQGRPYLDAVNWIVIGDDATTVAALQTKQIDMLDLSSFGPDVLNQVKKARPDAVEYDFLNSEANHVYLNVSRPPLDDARIRKAVGFAVNRDELIKVLGQGRGQWALAAAQPGLFTEEEVKQILKYDPAQAKQLVSQAGIPDGPQIEFMFPGEKYGQQYVSAIQLLQSQFKQVGINLTLKSVTPGDDGALRRTSSFQMTMTPNGFNDPLDDGASVYALFHPKSGNNYGKVNDPQLTALLEQQRQEVDPAKRRELIRSAVRYANEVPWAFDLFYRPGFALWQPYVKNYAPNSAPGNRGYPILNTWLEK